MGEKKSIQNIVLIIIYLLIIPGFYLTIFSAPFASIPTLFFTVAILVHFFIGLYIMYDAKKRKYDRNRKMIAFFIGLIFGFFSLIPWSIAIYRYFEKGKKHKKKDHFYDIYRDSGWAVSVLVIVFLLFFIFDTYSGFLSHNGASELETEYNKRVQTLNEDINIYNSLIEERNSVEDINDLILIGRKAIAEYTLAKSHIDEFNLFINRNEEHIRQYLDADFYSIRKPLNDFDVEYRNFLRDIEIVIRDYNTQSEAQRTAIEELLRLYGNWVLI